MKLYKVIAEGMVRVPLGGPWGTVPELLFEMKELIPALQKILVNKW